MDKESSKLAIPAQVVSGFYIGRGDHVDSGLDCRRERQSLGFYAKPILYGHNLFLARSAGATSGLPDAPLGGAAWSTSEPIWIYRESPDRQSAAATAGIVNI